jgi:predicted RNase H-like HicB family nuclease
MPAYIALLRKEPTSDFGVDFPDFPGCVTAGKTLEEARRMAAEALELHVGGMREDGDPIPFPSTLDAIMDDHANRDAVAFMVDVTARPAPSVRINIMLPHGPGGSDRSRDDESLPVPGRGGEGEPEGARAGGRQAKPIDQYTRSGVSPGPNTHCEAPIYPSRA